MMKEEEIEDKENVQQTADPEEENSEIRNERVDRLQEKMNGMDIEKRKKLFVRAVAIVFVFIVVKFCLGIACSRTSSPQEKGKQTEKAVTAEDSLEQIANKILDYEFKPKRKRSPEVEDALNALVEEDRAEAAKRDSINRLKGK